MRTIILPHSKRYFEIFPTHQVLQELPALLLPLRKIRLQEEKQILVQFQTCETFDPLGLITKYLKYVLQIIIIIFVKRISLKIFYNIFFSKSNTRFKQIVI
jgi:hypothetical protein